MITNWKYKQTRRNCVPVLNIGFNFLKISLFLFEFMCDENIERKWNANVTFLYVIKINLKINYVIAEV